VTDTLYYAYGVLAATEPAAVTAEVRGVGGAEVSLLPGARLAVAFSSVPADQFEESSLERRLEDPDWTSTLAMSHFEAVAGLHSRVPVLPLRLCTVFRSAQRAVATVDANTLPLEQALATVAGCDEWSVTVRGARAPATATTPEPTTGAEYLRRVASRGRQRAEEMVEAEETARDLHALLAGLAVATEPAVDTAGSGVRRTYLVHRRNARRFLDVLERSDAGATRLAVDVRGPWAPYSFVPVLREAA
jgi:hypothetical protein